MRDAFDGTTKTRKSRPGQAVHGLVMRQYKLTNFIWATLLTRVLANRGLPTTIARLCARDSATLSRFALNKNSMPRGELSPLLAHMDTMTTGASCP